MMWVAGSFGQNAKPQCCTIIDMSKEKGTFTIRDIKSGRIQLFKPDALDGAELKIGDTVDAKFELMKTVSVKGASKSYDLLDASYGDSCCIIIKMDTILPDSVFKVTAKNISSGQHIYFNAPFALRPAVDSGVKVFTQASHGYAMIASKADSTRTMLFGFPLLQENNK